MGIDGKCKIQITERRDGKDMELPLQYGQVNSPKSAMNRFRKTVGTDPRVRLEVNGIKYTGQDLARYEFYLRGSDEYVGCMEVHDDQDI